MCIIINWLKTEDTEVKKAAKGKKKYKSALKLLQEKKNDQMIFPQSRRKKYISEFSKKIINGMKFCVE